MNKTPIAIALERQIPEYVRGEYELFVNFIKAYYEFLNQTQQRNLEDVRSIENTLDEFVIRFKKELSVLFPTNSLENERFILQRIREFYQSRGSKESFQFLFRILFNKDSDIFYPSTQILRASDGKWVQEKSVFVKSESGNLFNLNGKIINIQTANKEIHVFCPRVVYYRDDIYEVFIDRAYVQDISISDKVISADGEDYGYILPCPNKYTITTEGAGFEIGKLYYLKTETGDGSLIKITKIGTGGSIKKVQVISFGLDYESTYYAKLSNKQAVAVPYRHPVPGPYPDGINGFVDYGYINRQDYFYFDEYYTPSVENNQNVFYADGTYVGEVIGSFYTNASNTNVIDGDTAEIKIDLGAVAIYPGYYSASDGFISDESYIQDGKYYQLFSYVIKVEQQIESYYDIVKELLHPAGLELYAEYTIKNDYLVSASPLLAFIRRQFLEQQYITDDEGVNVIGKYIPITDSVLYTVHTFLDDIKNVQLSIQKYKPDGTLSNETDELRWSVITPIAHNYYYDEKIILSSDSTYSTSDIRYNDVYKPAVDSSTLDDIITTKGIVQLKEETQTIDSETNGRSWYISSDVNGTFYKTVDALDYTSIFDNKVILSSDSTYSTFDSSYNDIGKNVTDTSTSDDIITTKGIVQPKQDIQTIDSETNGRSWHISSDVDGTFYKTVDTSDYCVPILGRHLIDEITLDETTSKVISYDRSIADTPEAIDLYSNLISPSTKTEISTVVGGEWSWDGTQYILVNPEIRIGTAYDRSFTDSINNITNTGGIIYVNAYNQDTSDPNSSYSYEAEIYSERITRAIS